jgi:hypothetical protein
VEIVEADPVTGKKTPLVAVARRALRALKGADLPFAVIGATALGVRGLPRFTADLDVVVAREDAFAALTALEAAGFSAVSPIERDARPEAMYVLRHGKGSVDVLVASAEPESTVIAETTTASVFGVEAPVASSSISSSCTSTPISRGTSATWRASSSKPRSTSPSWSDISLRRTRKCLGS